MAVEIEDLRRRWPAELFAVEAREMRSSGYADDNSLGALLDEAFADGLAYRLFNEVNSFGYRGKWRPSRPPANPWGAIDPWVTVGEHSPQPEASGPPADRAPVQLFDHLASAVSSIPPMAAPRYYRERRRPRPADDKPRWETFRTALGECLEDLNDRGYFELRFGSVCCDADSDPNAAGDQYLSGAVFGAEEAFAAPVLWPPTGATIARWDLETTLSVTEALFDVVARPRTRHWHEYAEEWDYDDHSRQAGQRVYIWKVNELLEGSAVSLRLADTGEDRGLLVQVAGDDRDRLVRGVLDAVPEPAARERVEHAIASLRQRGGATRTEKRAAILSLHHILENRRDDLKKYLLKGDEGALFEIANRFDLRHHKADQYAEYGDQFLDWVFWWYLATVELVHRLDARPVEPGTEV